MTTSWRRWNWKLGLASWLAMGGAIATSIDCALAQITPDGTLGAESSVVTPTDVNGLPSNQIDGGATRGANLFHSFEQFSVPTGGEAFFNNALDIQNIISRVTGTSISNIDGLIRANGAANLFLLNPNGINFGSNASLSIGGSFVGSTASSLNFADGTQFSATAPQTTSLLTVSVPIGLQYGGTAGSILNQSRSTNSNGEVGLAVQPGETLALVGGNVALENGDLTADKGRIELGSVGSPSLVSLTPTEQGWALGYEGVQNFQDIQLSESAEVRGDDVQVRGRQVTLDNSYIYPNNLTVTASELVKVSGQSNLYAGNLTITTGKLIVQDGGELSTSTYSGGTGNLTVTASELVEVSGIDNLNLTASSLSSFFGDNLGAEATGDLTITTGKLIVQDGGQIETNALYTGDAGDLIIRASDSVEVSGRGGIFAQTALGSTGAGGNLTIETKRLEGAQVAVRSFGQGSPGKLTVITQEPLPTVSTQIVPDATLPIKSTVRSNLNTSIINNSIEVGTQLGSNSIIEGGTQVGSNLFHSFEQFSIPTGSAAYFNNALDIQNIISRVTGTSISNIDGLIRANGTANLFLLNPNGINFGSTASLNIGGSFVGSTASSLNFADGTQFSATAPQTTPLLSVSVPIDLQFGGTPGDIRVQGSRLGVLSGETLALVGGNVTIENVKVDDLIGPAPSRQIEFGSVAGPSLVSLIPKNQGWSLGYEGVQNFQDIQLSQVSYGVNDTDIQLAGRRVTLTDTDIYSRNLSIRAGQLITQTTNIFDTYQDMVLSAYENVTLTASDFAELSDTYLSVGTFGFGYEGTSNLVIDTKRLVIRDSFVGPISNARGYNPSEVGELQGGNLTVTASESVEVINSLLSTRGGVTGNNLEAFYLSPGNLTITTGKLIVRDGGLLSVGSSGVFPGGNLTINASESVRVSGTGTSPYGEFPSTLSAEFSPRRFDKVFYTTLSAELSPGRAGSIVINTPQLNIEDGAEVRVSSTGTGDAGNIEVTARSISLDDQGKLLAETESGLGGDITLRTQDLLLLRGNSQISTTAGTAQAGGDGGNITIDTDLLVSLENSDITANAFEGRGGNIRIDTQGIFGTQLGEQLTPESDITASSNLGPEFSGTVEINTPDVDPSRGLVNLPTQPVDTEVAQACQPGESQNQSEFIITGRGGLPPSPNEALSSDAIQVDWVTLNLEVEDSPSPAVSTNPTNRAPTQIVEAQGWVVGSNGEVILTATPPTVTLNIPWLPSVDCHAPKTPS